MATTETLVREKYNQALPCLIWDNVLVQLNAEVGKLNELKLKLVWYQGSHDDWLKEFQEHLVSASQALTRLSEMSGQDLEAAVRESLEYYTRYVAEERVSND